MSIDAIVVGAGIGDVPSQGGRWRGGQGFIPWIALYQSSCCWSQDAAGRIHERRHQIKIFEGPKCVLQVIPSMGSDTMEALSFHQRVSKGKER